MEMSQGYSLCSYLIQIKMSGFFLLQIRKQEGRTGPACGGRGGLFGTTGREEEMGKGHKRVNIV
jgi:hypothetical protein